MQGTSLAVQWLRFRTPNAGGMGSIPGPGTKILLPATACCCLMQVAAYCCVCPKSLGATVLIEFTD